MIIELMKKMKKEMRILMILKLSIIFDLKNLEDLKFKVNFILIQSLWKKYRVSKIKKRLKKRKKRWIVALKGNKKFSLILTETDVINKF